MALIFLANDSVQIKKALLRSFTSLISLVLDSFSKFESLRVCGSMLETFENLLCDKVEDVREMAIQIVVKLNVLMSKDFKKRMMEVALNLMQDKDEKLRCSAVKLLIETLVLIENQESKEPIVDLLRLLGDDWHSTVRCTVVKNLSKLTANISYYCFAQKIFPLC